MTDTSIDEQIERLEAAIEDRKAGLLFVDHGAYGQEKTIIRKHQRRLALLKKQKEEQ